MTDNEIDFEHEVKTYLGEWRRMKELLKIREGESFMRRSKRDRVAINTEYTALREMAKTKREIFLAYQCLHPNTPKAVRVLRMMLPRLLTLIDGGTIDHDLQLILDEAREVLGEKMDINNLVLRDTPITKDARGAAKYVLRL